jgi:hypothetical protein
MTNTVIIKERIHGIALSLNLTIIQNNKKKITRIKKIKIFTPASKPIEIDNPLPPLKLRKNDQLCPIIRNNEAKIYSL